MNTIPIFKSEIADRNAFELLLSLYGCNIASIEPEYYIIEGSTESLDDFRNYWSDARGF